MVARWISNVLVALGVLVAVPLLLVLAAFFWLIDGEIGDA